MLGGDHGIVFAKLSHRLVSVILSRLYICHSLLLPVCSLGFDPQKTKGDGQEPGEGRPDQAKGFQYDSVHSGGADPSVSWAYPLFGVRKSDFCSF